ncbi:MAG: tetratricopeptide repeat protein [Acidobacteria bacterium]|nr:tetratricopeptide repeat protein [Acidobacteriota bacterium]MBS1865525.1 tetratricopeptide repeat protein [Acidobacteriota bacterium]
MALKQNRAVLALGVALCASAILVSVAGAQAFATAGQTQNSTDAQTQNGGETRATTSSRADAYFNYTMGHIAEQQFEQTSRSEYATQAIEYYKRAYALDPKSSVIGERLAEMYWKAQRIREAETEAKGILQRDPNDVQTRRLLGHIYLRSLGGANGNGQSEAVTRAADQFKEVVRLDPADTESALWLARLYRLQNKHELAEGVLRGILKYEPENEAGVEQLTQLLLDQGKSGEAVALLEGVTAKSSSPTLLDLLGDAYTQTKDLAKAEAAYRKATEIDPSEMSHQRGLGQTLLAEEKYSEALKVYQKLEDLMPDDADVYLRLAQIYRELHQFDKAEDTLTKARQYLPGSLDVMYSEAMLYQSQGRNEDAIRVLSEAVTGVKGQSEVLPTRRRNLAVLYQQLGKLYSDTENYSAAVNTYAELGRLGEDEDHRARLLLMETYRTAKDLPRALQAGKDALAKYPEDGPIKNSYALLLGEAGKTDDALALLKPLLKGKDGDRDVYLNISQVYERGRKYKEAEQAARTAEALPGAPRDNVMTWFLLGAIYERQKFYDRAEAEFKKVLAVDPQNAAALNYYGYMLGDLGIRLDEAEAMVKKALEEDQYNGAYLDSLGWIYYKQGKYMEAEEPLRRAVERESHDPTIHSHLGDVYAKTGRPELAAAQWEKSLEEWRRVLPADIEPEKIAEVEKKVNQSKHRVAQKAAPNAAQPK